MGLFDRETQLFRDCLQNWIRDHEGKWVVIHEDRVLGLFGTHAEGLQAATDQLDEQAFLLRQIVSRR